MDNVEQSILKRFDNIQIGGGGAVKDPKEREKQHAQLLILYKQKLPQYEALIQMRKQFNTKRVENSWKNWWKRFEAEDFKFPTRGRPPSRSPSVSSADPDELMPEHDQSLTHKHPRPHSLKILHSDEALYAPDTPVDLKSPPTSRARFFDYVPDLSQNLDTMFTDEDHDGYADVTGKDPISQDQEVDNDYGNAKISETKQPRSKKGCFMAGKQDFCVFCLNKICFESENAGYSVLNCGLHFAHWDSAYASYYTGQGLQICPIKTCKIKKRVHCSTCHDDLGMGCYETICSCNVTKESKADNIHADNLQTNLRDNFGKCGCCGNPHSGFCILCNKLFLLSPVSGMPNKLLLKCCNSYLHSECGIGISECPHKCGFKWQNPVEIIFEPVCVPSYGQKTKAFVSTIQTNLKKRDDYYHEKNIPARKRTGGRPVAKDNCIFHRRASSNVSSRSSIDEYALTQEDRDKKLMPPPTSLFIRRSTRRRSLSVSSNASESHQSPRMHPITTKCPTTQSSHFGYGCAAKSSCHMPDYYNSLKEGTKYCCYCDAPLLPSEAKGPNSSAKCCAKNRVNLKENFQKLQDKPEEINLLFESNARLSVQRRKEFFKNPLGYNNNLAFGHIKFYRADDVRDYRIIKINNNIEYMLWDYNRLEEDMPLAHGQLFTIPAEQASIRIGEIADDPKIKLDQDLLHFFYDVINRHHTMAELYFTAAQLFDMMNEDEQKQLRILLVDTDKRGVERKVTKGGEIQPVTISADEKRALLHIHPGRLGVQTIAGNRLVAQIYLNSGDSVPHLRYDVVLFGRKGYGIQNMKWWNRNIDPTLFPILFLKGQFGFETGIPLCLGSSEQYDEKSKQICNVDTKEIITDEELGEEEEFLDPIKERYFQRKDNVSRTQWIRYMMHLHTKDLGWDHPHWLWDNGSLAQLYIVSYNNRMEAQKVQFAKKHQDKRVLVRSSALLQYLDILRKKQGIPGQIGRVYLTDEHFRGSREYYQKEYANCITICREIGQPDLLITFTMNPDCPELKEMMRTYPDGPTQEWFNRPDLCCRLFIDKVEELKKDLFIREVMGPVKGWFMSTEHQKRGLPHVHIAVILDWERMRNLGNILTRKDYMAQYISAQIPDERKGRSKEALHAKRLYELVITNMIHTCAPGRCLVDGKCLKRFPKPYEFDNICPEHEWPRYKRLPEEYGGNTCTIKGNKITNAFVVPHNIYLLLKYGAHINVELIVGDGCTKYIIKYVMKGGEMAFIIIKDGQEKGKLRYDEFHQIRLARYVTSMEAFLSLWGRKLVERSHRVDELDVHTPEGKRVPVKEGFGDEKEKVEAYLDAAEKEKACKDAGEEQHTQLTAYFMYNRENPPLMLTYATCYKKIRYIIPLRKWQLYVDHSKAGHKLCRLKTVSPRNLELLAIRALLTLVEDPKGWDDLRTYKNIHYPDFVTAAKARGLLADNQIWSRIIMESFATNKTLYQRINWLAVFFALTNLTEPASLLEIIINHPSDWLIQTSVAGKTFKEKQEYVLRKLEWFLRVNGVEPIGIPREDGTFETACEHIGLPRPNNFIISQEEQIRLAFFPDDVLHEHIGDDFWKDEQRPNEAKERYTKLFNEGPKPSEEQQKLIDLIQNALFEVRAMKKDPYLKQACFHLHMVTGEGGAGKTFCYNKIIANAKKEGFNFLPMASVGIAAELLYEGQTVHKRLCRQKHIDSSTFPNVDRESAFAEMLRAIDGMIIDEISMQHRDVFEYVDRLLRYVEIDHKLRKMPFAGKVLLIGGDWKQNPPVVVGGIHLDQYTASVKMSPLFKFFQKHRLTTNHRLQSGQEKYRQFLKRIATGSLNDENSRVQIPKKILANSQEEILDFVFPKDLLENPLEYWEQLSDRAVLCPLNAETFKLNNKLMDQINGDELVYHAVTTPVIDESSDVEAQNNIADVDIENLQKLTPSGIPEHRLRVRVGAVMLIIKNISVNQGLCNGTRVQILGHKTGRLQPNIIKCRILSGRHRGEYYDLYPTEFIFGGDPRAPHEGTIKCKRVQFPLRPGMAMTFNKAQGQTLQRVGLLLDNSECFSHGQLYVGLSRVRDAADIRIFTKNPQRRVKNIVIRELLDKIDLEDVAKFPENDPEDEFPQVPPSANDSETEINASNSFQSPQQFYNNQIISPQVTPLSLYNISIDVNETQREQLNKINIVMGDITRQRVDMIVNASNGILQRGGGVDNAIHSACGWELQDSLDHINVQRPINAGNVIVTPAFGKLINNGTKIIAHAVGPVVLQGSDVTDEQKAELKQCYYKSLDTMIEYKCRTIAFPALSTGVFNFPRDHAVNCVFESLLQWLTDHKNYKNDFDEIRLVTFSFKDTRLYKETKEKVKRQIVCNQQKSKSRTPKTPHSVPNLHKYPCSDNVFQTPKEKPTRFSMPTIADTPARPKTCVKSKKTIGKIPAPVNIPLSSVQSTCTDTTDKPLAIVKPIQSIATLPVPINNPLSTVLQQQQQQQFKANLETLTGADGNCFYYSCVRSMFGIENRRRANILRINIFDLLNSIANDNNLYPRTTFDTRERFFRHLRTMLLPRDVLRPGDVQPPQYRDLASYENFMKKNFEYAALSDAMLVSILLERPVIVIKQRAMRNERITNNLTEIFNNRTHNLDIFLQDGRHQMLERPCPINNLRNFTISVSRAVGSFVPEDVVVDNPIVIAYNGSDHFMGITFTPHQPAFEKGKEQINSLHQFTIPSILQNLPPNTNAPDPSIYADDPFNLPEVIDVDMSQESIEIARSISIQNASAPNFEMEGITLVDDTHSNISLNETCELCHICEVILDFGEEIVEMQGCGKFHRRCFDKWIVSPTSHALKSQGGYEFVCDNCPICHRRSDQHPISRPLLYDSITYYEMTMNKQFSLEKLFKIEYQKLVDTCSSEDEEAAMLAIELNLEVTEQVQHQFYAIDRLNETLQQADINLYNLIAEMKENFKKVKEYIAEENNIILSAVCPRFRKVCHQHFLNMLLSINISQNDELAYKHAYLVQLRAECLSETIRAYLTCWQWLNRLNFDQINEMDIHKHIIQKYWWQNELNNLREQWQTHFAEYNQQKVTAMTIGNFSMLRVHRRLSYFLSESKDQINKQLSNLYIEASLQINKIFSQPEEALLLQTFEEIDGQIHNNLNNLGILMKFFVENKKDSLIVPILANRLNNKFLRHEQKVMEHRNYANMHPTVKAIEKYRKCVDQSIYDLYDDFILNSLIEASVELEHKRKAKQIMSEAEKEKTKESAYWKMKAILLHKHFGWNKTSLKTMDAGSLLTITQGEYSVCLNDQILLTLETLRKLINTLPSFQNEEPWICLLPKLSLPSFTRKAANYMLTGFNWKMQLYEDERSEILIYQKQTKKEIRGRMEQIESLEEAEAITRL